MHTRYSMGGGALIAALLTSTASFAQVTPQQVWDDWRGYMQSFGYEVTATETASGNDLDVSGMSISMVIPDDQGNVSVTWGDMRFADNGDGSVSIVMPETMPVNVDVVGPDGEHAEIALSYFLPGMKMVAKGTPGDMQYTFEGDEMNIVLDKLTVDGKPEDSAKFEFGFADVTGNFNIKTGDMRVIQENVTAAGGMRYEFAITSPEGNGEVNMKGMSDRMAIFATIALPLEYDPADINMALKNGMATDATFTLGAGGTEFSFKDAESFSSGKSETSSSSMHFTLDATKMAYGFALNDWKVAVMGSDIPLPINFSTGKTAMEINMPIAQSDVPQDIGASIQLIDFAPDDMIWGMLDPTGGLPHNPATLIIDIAGKANWLVDVLDPANADALLGDKPPFELQALSINDLEVSAAGAELTGTGSFVFNNADLETFDGLPAPDGTVDLKLVGANGLIDSLIGMGLMSEDDASGMRMMMGLFGRPGEGEDEVLSTVEVRQNGEIYANGQRLQ